MVSNLVCKLLYYRLSMALEMTAARPDTCMITALCHLSYRPHNATSFFTLLLGPYVAVENCTTSLEAVVGVLSCREHREKCLLISIYLLELMQHDQPFISPIGIRLLPSASSSNGSGLTKAARGSRQADFKGLRETLVTMITTQLNCTNRR